MRINKLDTYGEWMVNDKHLYTPSAGVRVDHTNVASSNTGRTEDGVTHIEWVRRDIRKVYITYSAMSAHELDYMLNLMQGKEFKFTFKDRGNVCTMNGYTGECTYTFYTDSKAEGIYTDVSINVIEL